MNGKYLKRNLQRSDMIDLSKFSFLEIFNELPIECIFYRTVRNGKTVYVIECDLPEFIFKIGEDKPRKAVMNAFHYFVLVDGICEYGSLEKSDENPSPDCRDLTKKTMGL